MDTDGSDGVQLPLHNGGGRFAAGGPISAQHPEQAAPMIEAATAPDEGTDEEQLIRSCSFEHGRRYQAFQNGRYPIPNDEFEQNREDMKHAMMLQLTEGRLFYAPVDNPKVIVDVGTGTGIWAIDAGDRFPHAYVYGMDMSPIQPEWVPPNVEFYVDDCEREWSLDDCDLAHFRFMTSVVRNPSAVFRNAYQSLKPGGWIELQELNATPRCDDQTMGPDDAVKRVYDLVAEAFAHFGMDVSLPTVLGPMLRGAGFDNVHCVVKKVPIGAWALDPALRVIGHYQRLAVQDFLPALAGRPFEALGMSRTESEVTLALARNALKDMRVHRYFCYYFWYAQKPVNSNMT